MDTYVILRRDGWKTPEELEEAAKVSSRVGDEEMPNDIRWIRSYVIQCESGKLGTACIYQASTPEAIRDHARRVGMPADEVIPVAKTVVVRPDPDRA